MLDAIAQFINQVFDLVQNGAFSFGEYIQGLFNSIAGSL